MSNIKEQGMYLKDKCLSRFEIEILFRNVMNLEQQEKTSQLIKLLGKYMVLDRDMINERAYEKIGLSYIARAVRYGFLAEFEYDNKYFFQLGAGGVNFLQIIGYHAYILPLDITRHDRQKILTANRYMIDKDIDLDMSFPMFIKSGFLVCENNIIIYFANEISNLEEIAKKLILILKTEEHTPTAEEILDQFEFKKITTPIYEIGPKAKGISFSHLEQI